MGKTNFDDLELGDRSIQAREIGSESAADGQVLTADGTGGAAWEDAAGGATQMVGTALIGGDLTGNARGAYAVDLQSKRSDPELVASGSGSVAIGYNAKASGYASIAIGANRPGGEYQTYADNSYGVAIGIDARIGGAGSIGIGYAVRTSGNFVVAIGGGNARGYGVGAVVVGARAEAGAQNAVALGYMTEATAANAVAIGGQVVNSTANSVKIGWNNSNFAHFTTFTPTSGTPSASHYLPVNLGGTVYKFLLAT